MDIFILKSSGKYVFYLIECNVITNFQSSGSIISSLNSRIDIGLWRQNKYGIKR